MPLLLRAKTVLEIRVLNVEANFIYGSVIGQLVLVKENVKYEGKSSISF